jgi:hypothetical protein
MRSRSGASWQHCIYAHPAAVTSLLYMNPIIFDTIIHELTDKGLKMQCHEVQVRPSNQRQWLGCDIDRLAQDVCSVWARKNMLKPAVFRGMGEPLIMDATHGLQRYWLNLVTVHAYVLHEENSGECFFWSCVDVIVNSS